MSVYVGISRRLVIEAGYYISAEAVAADRELSESCRKYSVFETSLNFKRVNAVKYKGKNYLIKSTHIDDSTHPVLIVDGPIPILKSGRN